MRECLLPHVYSTIYPPFILFIILNQAIYFRSLLPWIFLVFNWWRKLFCSHVFCLSTLKNPWKWISPKYEKISKYSNCYNCHARHFPLLLFFFFFVCVMLTVLFSKLICRIYRLAWPTSLNFLFHYNIILKNLAFTLFVSCECTCLFGRSVPRGQLQSQQFYCQNILFTCIHIRLENNLTANQSV